MRCSRPDLYLADKICGLPTLVHLRKGRECSSRSQLDAENAGRCYRRTVTGMGLEPRKYLGGNLVVSK